MEKKQKNVVCGFEQIVDAAPPPKKQPFDHLPSISQAIQVRREIYAERTHKQHSPMDFYYGHTIVGRSTNTFNHQLCTDTGRRLEVLSRAMTYRYWWRWWWMIGISKWKLSRRWLFLPDKLWKSLWSQFNGKYIGFYIYICQPRAGLNSEFSFS